MNKTKGICYAKHIVLCLTTYAIVIACMALFSEIAKRQMDRQTIVEGIFPTTITLVLSMLMGNDQSKEEHNKSNMVNYMSIFILVLYVILGVVFSLRTNKASFVALLCTSILAVSLEIWIVCDAGRTDRSPKTVVGK